MFERIVAAIDSDPERGAKVAAAAQELAQQSGSRALVVHVAHGRKTPSIITAANAMVTIGWRPIITFSATDGSGNNVGS